MRTGPRAAVKDLVCNSPDSIFAPGCSKPDEASNTVARSIVGSNLIRAVVGLPSFVPLLNLAGFV